MKTMYTDWFKGPHSIPKASHELEMLIKELRQVGASIQDYDVAIKNTGNDNYSFAGWVQYKD